MSQKIFFLALIIVIAYFVSLLIIKTYPEVQSYIATIYGSFFSGFECQHITSASRTISAYGFTHICTITFDKGVYTKGESATVSTTLDPGLSSFELGFISGNQINSEAKIYQGTFDGTTCTGQLIMTVPHSIDKSKLGGTGKVTFSYTDLVNYSFGCTCIRIDVLGMPITVDPFYFQIETLDSGTTTSSSSSTSSTSTSTIQPGSTSTSSASTTTVPTTTTSPTTTSTPTTTTSISVASTTILPKSTTTGSTTIPQTTTTSSASTTIISSTTIEENKPSIDYSMIIIILSIVGLTLISIFFIYPKLKPNQYQALKEKWGKR